MSGIRFGAYRTGTHDELFVARGPQDGPQVLFVPPLFEEANRCRALIAEIQRRLAAIAIGSALIDLPGSGDSIRPLESVTFEEWTDAVADARLCLGDRVIIASVRGGALIDRADHALGWWRFSPVDGAALIRDLDRAQQVAARRDGAGAAGGARAGYPIGASLVDALATAKPLPRDRVRTIRLESEAAQADARVAGPPLWRRPEPEQDITLAGLLADDLGAWVARCVG